MQLIWKIPSLKTGATYYHTQLRFTDKCYAIKELVGCTGCEVSAVGPINKKSCLI